MLQRCHLQPETGRTACSDPGIFFRGGGGGGGVQARWPENSLDNLFLLDLNLFYSLQRGYNGFITEKSIHCQGSRGGPTFSRGVQLFPGWGVQMQISIETHITCDFPGGGGGGGGLDPVSSPLDRRSIGPDRGLTNF